MLRSIGLWLEHDVININSTILLTRLFTKILKHIQKAWNLIFIA